METVAIAFCVLVSSLLSFAKAWSRFYYARSGSLSTPNTDYVINKVIGCSNKSGLRELKFNLGSVTSHKGCFNGIMMLMLMLSLGRRYSNGMTCGPSRVESQSEGFLNNNRPGSRCHYDLLLIFSYSSQCWRWIPLCKFNYVRLITMLRLGCLIDVVAQLTSVCRLIICF